MNAGCVTLSSRVALPRRRPLDREATRPLPRWALVVSTAMLLVLRSGIGLRCAAFVVERIFARIGFFESLFSTRVPNVRRAFVQSLLRTVHRDLAGGRRRLAPLARWVAILLVSAVRMPRRAASFTQKHGFAPPAFLVVTATERCNFECAHCYARSSARSHRSLDFATFSRIVADQREQWGASLVIVTGGEPFLYADPQGDLLALARRHPSTQFIVYTNGTRITEAVAEELAELGNVVPLVSLEGDEAHTAAVRDPRAWKAAHVAMRNLRKAGVLFGVSLTASRSNAALLGTADYYRRLRDEHGATFFWVLERAPLGRGAGCEPDLLTFEDKRRLQGALGEMLTADGLLVVSFLHTPGAHSGCMGAGRVDGFFHVRSGGEISHCVYSPFRLDDVHDIYASGEELSRFLFRPAAAAIRKAQADFFARGFDEGCHRPCPVIQRLFDEQAEPEHARDTSVCASSARPVDQGVQ